MLMITSVLDKLPYRQEVEIDLQVQRGLLRLVAIGDQPRKQVHEEIIRAAVAGVLNLADVLELVVDALDNRALAQQQLVGDGKESLAHVPAYLGDQPKPLCGEDLLGQCGGDVAPITKELAEQAAHQAGHGTAVIDIARGQAERQQFAPVIDR